MFINRYGPRTRARLMFYGVLGRDRPGLPQIRKANRSGLGSDLIGSPVCKGRRSRGAWKRMCTQQKQSQIQVPLPVWSTQQQQKSNHFHQPPFKLYHLEREDVFTHHVWHVIFACLLMILRHQARREGRIIRRGAIFIALLFCAPPTATEHDCSIERKRVLKWSDAVCWILDSRPSDGRVRCREADRNILVIWDIIGGWYQQ